MPLSKKFYTKYRKLLILLYKFKNLSINNHILSSSQMSDIE